MDISLSKAQEVVEVYANSNQNLSLFKYTNLLPYPKEVIKHSIKYLIILFETLHKQNTISDQEYINLLNDHITIYISLATYIDNEDRVSRLQNNEVVNNAFECSNDIVETVEIIKKMDLTDTVYNDVLCVVNESVKLEGEIRKYVREKQKNV